MDHASVLHGDEGGQMVIEAATKKVWLYLSEIKDVSWTIQLSPRMMEEATLPSHYPQG